MDAGAAYNSYLWNIKKVNSRGTVIIENKYNYTRKEAKLKGIDERDELGNILIQRTDHYFTFAKPIYSRNRKIALIAYSYNANNILYVFEKINENWIFKLVLSQNYMI